MAFLNATPIALRRTHALPASCRLGHRVLAGRGGAGGGVGAASAPKRAYAARALLGEGAALPKFSATDTAGNAVTDDMLRGKPAVLYFMAGSGPGCTQQSCAFRDAAAEFNKLDAAIIGVSARSGGASFKDQNGLTYPIVEDADGKLQALFGVPKTLGIIPGRVTFVIDPKGTIQKVFNAQFKFQDHVDIAKEAITAMAK